MDVYLHQVRDVSSNCIDKKIKSNFLGRTDLNLPKMICVNLPHLLIHLFSPENF